MIVVDRVGIPLLMTVVDGGGALVMMVVDGGGTLVMMVVDGVGIFVGLPGGCGLARGVDARMPPTGP